MLEQEIKNNLKDALYSGYIDGNVVAKPEYKPQLLVNDAERKTKVLTSIVAELETCDEFMFSVAFITRGGIAVLLNTLSELKAKGVKGKILTSQYQDFTEPKALRKLLEFDNIELKILSDGNFHAKGYLFRHNEEYSLIIGSSNLTENALCVNKEWNLKVSSMGSGSITNDIVHEFERQFSIATPITDKWIDEYETIYSEKYSCLHAANTQHEEAVIDAGHYFTAKPNRMQFDALTSLATLREENQNKALLISATGTGKTYLSAFDAKAFGAKKLLFVIHREKIAKDAMRTFRRVFGNNVSMGLYTGNEHTHADFVFCTIQSLSKDEHLKEFDRDEFDYIVIDEVHHAGANSYQRIIDYFKPRFLLGMSATPERTDSYNIFKTFDYNIAYELRLNQALEMNMLSPFHYYGVTDLEVDDVSVETKDFSRLLSSERVKHIYETTRFYDCDRGRIKGLIFCSSVEEGKELSSSLNQLGLRTVCLSAENGEKEREDAIQLLESDDMTHYLDYIITRDIFNEGIDIPSVNQVVMLRPTQSAIVYVQQLGRGLRRTENKDYLTVIDFIGNYTNNYLVPIALYGDNSYNKDSIRRMVVNGNSELPGCSTIDFDKIAKERIYESINVANVNSFKELKKDYELLKYKLGRTPLMCDFLEYGSRDPYAYVEYSKSYYDFLKRMDNEDYSLPDALCKRIRFFSSEICNGKRIEDIILLKELLKNGEVSWNNIKDVCKELNLLFDKNAFSHSVYTINGSFLQNKDKPKFSVAELIKETDYNIFATEEFINNLSNNGYRVLLSDCVEYAYKIFFNKYNILKYRSGFMLYEKYSRKDVCKILKWKANDESTMYGYQVKYNTCPIFVNYEKDEDVKGTATDYEDYFINNSLFHWNTRHNVTLESNEVKQINNYKETNLRILLFVKKSNGESDDFYYIGDMIPEQFTQGEKFNNKRDKYEPIVHYIFKLIDPVDNNLYDYFTK